MNLRSRRGGRGQRPGATDHASDSVIRIALKRSLVRRYRKVPGTVIIEELGLRHGTARVDLAVVNGLMHGFEIKSDVDTLRRLRRQADEYSAVLDRVTLVTGPKYLSPALHKIPSWWGVVEAGVRSGRVCLRPVRPARANPSLNALAVARLLWRDEALSRLARLGVDVGIRSKPRLVVYGRLTERLSLAELRSYVRQRLRRRGGWRSEK